MCVKQNDKYLSKILRDFCVIRAQNITYIILIDCIKRNIYSKKKNIFRSLCTIIYIDLFHIYFTYNKKKVFNEHLRLFRNIPPVFAILLNSIYHRGLFKEANEASIYLIPLVEIGYRVKSKQLERNRFLFPLCPSWLLIR